MTATATNPPIPSEIALVRSFVNTLDVDEGSDQLAQPDGLERWLVTAGLVSVGTPASGRDVRLAVRLRAALRAELATNHDRAHDPAVVTELERVCEDLPLRAVCSGDGLAPSAGGVRGALAQVVAAVTTARIKGTWLRLKICPADDCLWAFYDTSRNRSKRWCSMEVCGNRHKVRSFRDRSHAEVP
jgi:predicted RNA-binding Zn ribbon-like protein